MTELDKFNLMLQGGYNPMGGGITTNQMEDFKTAGLFNQIQDTNNRINSLNLQQAQNKRPPNVLQKIGSAFGQYGMDNRMPTDEFLNLPKNERRKMQIEGLQKFGEMMNLVAAQQSGSPQRIAQAQNTIAQRKAIADAEREEAERKARQEQRLQKQEEFIKNNPEFEQMIRFNQLFNMDMPQPKKRDSYVAKDGFRYYVDDGARVFPNVTVKEEQSQADIYKENAARIKNIVLNEGPNSKNLTKEEKAFYDDYINKKGIMTLDQAIAAMLQDGKNNQNTPVKYRVINNQYGSSDAEKIINDAQNLNPSLSREKIIQELILNNIIAE